MKKFLAVLGIFLLLWIWNTDAFQRNFFPKKYWGDEVIRLERSIEIFKSEKENTTLELMQFIDNYSIEYIEAYNRIKAMGKTEEYAYKMASQMVESDLEGRKIVLKALTSLLKESKESLEVAKKKYKNCK